MADKTELLHLPKSGGSALTLSEAHASLIARGRKEVTALVIHHAETVGRAIVAIRKGEPIKIGNDNRGFPPPRYYGLIDGTGDYVVDPTYRAIGPFSEGLASYAQIEPASDFLLHGYLNHDGQVVINPTFAYASEFCEGLAAVQLEHLWGFIRNDGSWAIRPQYDLALNFFSGHALVKVGMKWGVIARSGEYAIEPRFDRLAEFSQGLACAEINGKVGYIGLDGNFAIELQSARIDEYRDWENSFKFGVARVALNGRNSLINRAGDIVFQCEDDESIGEFYEGIAIVEMSRDWENGYYINSDGDKILLTYFPDNPYSVDADVLDAVEGFGEGLGVVAASFVDHDHGSYPLHRYRDREGSRRRYGYVDRVGEIKIPLKFSEAHPFREGFAVVRPKDTGSFGYINKSGEVLIEAPFTKVRGFANGMARVAQQGGVEGKWGFIDRDGKLAIQCRFDWADDFQKVVV